VRIKPAVSPEEAYRYLSQNAVMVWGEAAATRMEPQLQSISSAMTVVSALEIPDEIEPLFGEDIDRAVRS